MNSPNLHLGLRLYALRKQAKLSQQEVADRAGLNVAAVSRLERGVNKATRFATYQKLASVFGVPVEYLTDPVDDTVRLTQPAEASSPRTGRYSGGIHSAPADAIRRAGGATLLPVYRWGSAGDPRDNESSPYPDHEEFPPPGRESLVGPRGFGVMVKGDSMIMHGLNDGDTVWVNPDRTARGGDIVVARVWWPDGSEGMVVKMLSVSQDRLIFPPNEEPSDFRVIGPVVVAARYFQPAHSNHR